MKILLLKNVEKLGKQGEVKDVSLGYFKNFLMIKKLARLAGKQDVLQVQENEIKKEKQLETAVLETEALAKKLKGCEIVIKLKAGEKGQLFESVDEEKIKKQLFSQEKNLNTEKVKVILEEHIKKTGQYPVNLDLGHNIKTEIQVIVKAIEEKKTKTKD